MFTLNIRTDSDAFSPDATDARGRNWERDAEIARILRSIAERIALGAVDVGNSATLRDVNGNDVGRAKIAHDDEGRY